MGKDAVSVAAAKRSSAEMAMLKEQVCQVRQDKVAALWKGMTNCLLWSRDDSVAWLVRVYAEHRSAERSLDGNWRVSKQRGNLKLHVSKRKVMQRAANSNRKSTTCYWMVMLQTSAAIRNSRRSTCN